LLATLTPALKGELLDACKLVEGNIDVVRERLLAELEADPAAVEGWRVGQTRATAKIKDASESFQAVSEYLEPEEFAACCSPGKGRVVAALKAKLRAKEPPIKGMAADKLIDSLLAPVTVQGESKPKLERIEAP